jgi:hypothetical protein
VERRLAAFRRPDEHWLVVEQEAGALGTLGGTVAAWRAWKEAGGSTVGPLVIAHGAGSGLRAGPLAKFEVGGRASLKLPGTVRGQPARLLELVLHSLGPLGQSLPPGWVDVIWVSQVFVPRVAPIDVPPPMGALAKLAADQSDRSLDLGRFVLGVDGEISGFIPQGFAPPSGPCWTDLGSFRVRAGLLEHWAAHLHDRVDLDPGFVAHLWGPKAHPARQTRDAWGEPFLTATVLGTELPWWRFRRPEEVLAALQDLRPSCSRGAPLRRLLGLEDPVVRCWIGGQWVERLGANTVQHGVGIHGVHLVDAVLADSAISSGFIREAVVWEVAGTIAQTEGSSTATAEPGPNRWYRTKLDQPMFRDVQAMFPEHLPPWNQEDLLAVHGGNPATYPRPVLDRLKALAPAHSRLARLVSLLFTGGFPLFLHPIDRPMGVLAPERGSPGNVPLHTTECEYDLWCASPERGVEALLRSFTAHLCRPTPPGRAREAARTVDWYRRGAGDVRVPDPLRARAPSWQASEDPLELDLGLILASFVPFSSPPSDFYPYRAWARWRTLVHGQVDLGPGPGNLRFCDPSRGWVYLPALDLRPPRPPDAGCTLQELADDLLRRGARAIGICGPAAAGKTTLARLLVERQPDFQMYHADHVTWPGDGFRYRQGPSTRDITLAGPGIFDDVAIAAALGATTGPFVVEGCFVGLDPEVRRHLEVLVAVIAPDEVRLRDKLVRDSARSGRRIDIVADFAQKTFVEGDDGLIEVLALADEVWDRSTGDRWFNARAVRPSPDRRLPP